MHHRRRSPLPLLALLALAPLVLPACGDDSPSPTQPQPPVEDGHAFTYTPPTQAPAVASLSVRGSFNDWGERPMARQQDGSWRAVVKLNDGLHQYKFFINGDWPADMCHDPVWGDPARDYWIDPNAEGCLADGHGGRNAAIVLGEVEELLFSHSASAAQYVSVAGGVLSVRFRARTGQVQAAYLTTASDTFPMHVQLRVGLHDVWRAAVPTGTGTYGFRVVTASGAQTFGPYSPSAAPFTAQDWVGGSVGYQIFPERFWNGDPANDGMALATDSWHFKEVGGTMPYLTPWDGPIGNSHCCHQYFGGDLQGILDRLDHLTDLGVTLLYLNPIFTSGSAHGYDASDFMEIAPNFGDEAVLRALLDAAGARGMRVMWDFVPNHVGVGFWAFQDAVQNGPASPYWSWFTFRVPHDQIQVGNGNHYEGWWGLGSLPRLETRNAAAFEHLMDVTRHWTEFGLHGIRVDVPEEIRNRSAFFSAFRQAARAANPEVYLVGEVWHRDPSWLQGDQFDALMNYAIGEGVIERFAVGQLSASAAQGQMAQLYADYPEASTAMQFNLISSHDTNRLLTKLGGGNLGSTPSALALSRHHLASAFLYALPGVPVTFQGDECAFVGATAGGRDEHRYPMQWDACDAAMVQHYRQLASLREALPALRSPVIRAHQGTGGLLSFYRGEPGPGEVLAVFNSGSPQTLALPAGSWVDAATGETVTGSAQLDAPGWRYLRRQ
jgi:cyclomaltodextrinase / maltogenic alpha-amylase / neopullulanase